MNRKFVLALDLIRHKKKLVTITNNKMEQLQCDKKICASYLRFIRRNKRLTIIITKSNNYSVIKIRG